MKVNCFSSLAAFLLLTCIAFSSENSAHSYEAESSHYWRVGTNSYVSFIDDTVLQMTPTWTPNGAAKLPLSVEDIYDIAANELPLYVNNPGDWLFVKAVLHRFHRTEWWYYVVLFVPSKESLSRTLKNNRQARRRRMSERISIVVLMSGTPVVAKPHRSVLSSSHHSRHPNTVGAEP